MSNNCYLLHCAETDELVLDRRRGRARAPARADRRPVADRRRHHAPALGPPPGARRGHGRAPGALVVAGAPDADAITEQTGVNVDRRVGEGDTVAVGTCDLTVIPLAGHTPGSIALLLDDPRRADPAPLHRRLALPRRGRATVRRRRRLRPADRRGGDQDLRPAPRRDVVLPRPRRRRRARRRAAPPRGVARARLVAPASDLPWQACRHEHP